MRHALTMTLALLALLWGGCEDDPSFYAEDNQALDDQEIEMSVPLFIRTPITQADFVTSLQDMGPDAIGDLCTASAPTLIERILWAAHASGGVTLDGNIILSIVPPAGGMSYEIKHVWVPAADASVSGFLCGEIRLDLVLDTGWQLIASHTIQDAGPAAELAIAMTIQGGELQ